jgi:hypothetical protein
MLVVTVEGLDVALFAFSKFSMAGVSSQLKIRSLLQRLRGLETRLDYSVAKWLLYVGTTAQSRLYPSSIKIAHQKTTDVCHVVS